MNNLKHIEINIGKACNNKCLFCMSSKSELIDIKFVKLDKLKEKIKSYSEDGYKSIGFLGGDISIHPDIIEILSFCKKNGFININVISNGMKFDNFEFTEKIIESGLTRVNFSIHSHLDSVEDYLIQVKGGLQRKLKAIDNFQLFYNKGLLRDTLSINIVLNSKNYKTIVETVLFFFLKKNIKDIRINFIWLNKDVKENWDDLKLSYTEFLPYLKKLIYISLKYRFRLTFDTIPACIFYKIDNKNYKSLVKKFLGEDQDHIVEIDHINKDESFDWKKRKKDMLKMQFNRCEQCIYRDSCQGVRKEYGLIYGENEFIPIVDETNKELYKKEEITREITKKDNNLDLKHYYKKINKGDSGEIEKEIEDIYKENSKNESICNLYSVLLAKKKDYKKSGEVLLKLIEETEIKDKGNIYFNLAVSLYNLGNIKSTKKYINKAKIYKDKDENFMEFYDMFSLLKKDFNLDNYDEKIKIIYKDKEEVLNKYIYVNNLINNLKR